MTATVCDLPSHIVVFTPVGCSVFHLPKRWVALGALVAMRGPDNDITYPDHGDANSNAGDGEEEEVEEQSGG
ncbi:unnamed protein product [Microthlaspi erraticum]|uniref:Uncharacterized protein n=1 Tax=Microthlaspi erraticum TaxID=1685480 RepID=A0A6D2JJG5_9BRAS|nr:unnamed protein product [Microthlaspi erraticum]CAA7039221.1 unnamed protein product [Microthlaspi erraticum]